MDLGHCFLTKLVCSQYFFLFSADSYPSPGATRTSVWMRWIRCALSRWCALSVQNSRCCNSQSSNSTTTGLSTAVCTPLPRRPNRPHLRCQWRPPPSSRAYPSHLAKRRHRCRHCHHHHHNSTTTTNSNSIIRCCRLSQHYCCRRRRHHHARVARCSATWDRRPTAGTRTTITRTIGGGEPVWIAALQRQQRQARRVRKA